MVREMGLNKEPYLALLAIPSKQNIAQHFYINPIEQRNAILMNIIPGYAANVISESTTATSLFFSPSQVKSIVKNVFRMPLPAAYANNPDVFIDHSFSVLRSILALRKLMKTTVSTETFHENAGVRITCITTFSSTMALSTSYAFLYKILIENIGTVDVKVIGRHWNFTNVDGEVEVQVPKFQSGVVGQTPVISPGKGFEYTSYVAMLSKEGYMEGELLLTDMSTMQPIVARVDKCPLMSNSSLSRKDSIELLVM